MHADEINVAATEELGKEIYHYHLHAMVLPVVEKEILWSKRCKDEKLRGTVKEVVNQISHSKKWKSDIPLTDEKVIRYCERMESLCSEPHTAYFKMSCSII